MLITIILIICIISLVFLLIIQHIMILTLAYYMAEKEIEISEKDLKSIRRKVVNQIIKGLI